MRKIWSQVSSICWWFDASQIEVNSATLIKTASRAQVTPLQWYNMYVWAPVGAAESKPAWKNVRLFSCRWEFHGDKLKLVMQIDSRPKIDHGNELIAKLHHEMSFSSERFFRPPISAAVLQLLHYIALLSHTRTIDRPFSALESLPPQTLISSISAER